MHHSKIYETQRKKILIANIVPIDKDKSINLKNLMKYSIKKKHMECVKQKYMSTLIPSSIGISI